MFVCLVEPITELASLSATGSGECFLFTIVFLSVVFRFPMEVFLFQFHLIAENYNLPQWDIPFCKNEWKGGGAIRKVI